jgi:hypothetical protein
MTSKSLRNSTEHFTIIEKPNELFFSRLNTEVEGSYVEITHMTDVHELFERIL